MKRILALVAIALSFVALPVSAQSIPSAERLMQKVVKKLASTRALGYTYHFEFSEPGAERPFEERADAFLDLSPADGTSPFRFQFSTADKLTIYNGVERFVLDKKKKTISVENRPSFKAYGDILLHNSPLSLKYALPKIAADPSILKNVSLVRSEGRDQYLIGFSLSTRVINSAGEIIESNPDQANVYQLKIDKETFFPVSVLHTINKDVVFKTTYTEITDKPTMPTANSWFFSSYQNEYTLQKKNKRVLIEAAKTAPDFSLSGLDPSEKISLSQYKGKLVLLEFWIVNCGFCYQAVPRLNDIYGRFRAKGLEVLSINMYDPAAAIVAFKKRNKPDYTVLTGGDSLAAAYGVDGYPSVVLIGESGKVLYSSKGLDDVELEAAITSNLKSREP